MHISLKRVEVAQPSQLSWRCLPCRASGGGDILIPFPGGAPGSLKQGGAIPTVTEKMEMASLFFQEHMIWWCPPADSRRGVLKCCMTSYARCKHYVYYKTTDYGIVYPGSKPGQLNKVEIASSLYLNK